MSFFPNMRNKVDQLCGAVACWTIPPGIQHFLGEFIRTLPPKREDSGPTSGIGRLVQRNSELRDCHKGERCFLLATGPSVQNQDLTVLQGELCIAVSHFFLHKDIKVIAPKYHVIAPYHPPFTFDQIKRLFEGFNEFYPDDVTYFFGHRPYEYSLLNFLESNPQFKRKNSYFINYSSSHELDETNFNNPDSWDIAKSPFEIRTVVYSAIQVAIYMGCNEIYLIGCDHDYLLDMKRVTNHHFYKEEDGQSDVEVLTSFDTERWFQEYYYRWKEYRLMREYSKQFGCKIFNATKGGMLDVFPVVNFDNLFL